MAGNMMMIPDVKQGVKNWTIKVTITEEMLALVGLQRAIRYKGYMLTDDQASLETLSPYMVKTPIASQNAKDYSLHWVLHRDMLVRPLRGKEPNLRYFLDGVIPIVMIGETLPDPNDTIDIMGILIKADDVRSVTTKFGE
ncbi:hypothetical protein LIER_36017 [Lithospermum erythrorhizon]|uniref:Uncharacterized protein n=1 Tax=Lithospermum erythrorhizon TaxID=34254 RepID=A0AAV3NZI0_LITER